MALQGCYACIKYLVIIFNFLFWLAGIGVLALAVYTYVKSQTYTGGSEEIQTYFISLYILMAAGALMTVLGFLGCCGALRESECMLGSFFFLVLLILIAEIVAGVWAVLNKEKLENIITKELKRSIKEEYGRNELINKTIDAIQHDFSCCGAESPNDWKDSYFDKASGNPKDKSITDKLFSEASSALGVYNIPSSCCMDSGICAGIPLISSTYSEGCVPKLEKALKNNLTIVAGVGIGLGVIQILGLIFSIILCCAIRNGEGVSYHV